MTFVSTPPLPQVVLMVTGLVLVSGKWTVKARHRTIELFTGVSYDT